MCAVGLRELGQLSLEKSARGRLTSVYKYLRGERKGDCTGVSSVVVSDRTRGSRHKVEYRKFHLTVRNSLVPFKKQKQTKKTCEVSQTMDQVTQRG